MNSCHWGNDALTKSHRLFIKIPVPGMSQIVVRGFQVTANNVGPW